MSMALTIPLRLLPEMALRLLSWLLFDAVEFRLFCKIFYLRLITEEEGYLCWGMTTGLDPFLSWVSYYWLGYRVGSPVFDIFFLPFLAEPGLSVESVFCNFFVWPYTEDEVAIFLLYFPIGASLRSIQLFSLSIDDTVFMRRLIFIFY